MLAVLRDQLANFVRLHAMMNHDQRRHLLFACSEDLVLKRGIVYSPSQKKPPVERLPKACFQQSYRLSQRRNSRWVYVEGFALMPAIGIATSHAWVADADGPRVAHDLAWDACDAVYIGIPFERDFVRQMHIASGRKWFSVLDAWWINHPLLTGATRIDDVIWQGNNRALRGGSLNGRVELSNVSQ